MKKLILTTALMFGVVAPQSTFAADTYTVDASHTNILMSVSHLGFSNMVLEALQPVGTITFDQEDPTNSAVHITLKSEHIDGDDEKFNAHLQSADFFNVAIYPEITFKSTDVKVTGDNTGVVTGDLSLLGVTKPVSLDVTFNKAGVNAFSQAETVGFTATGTLKRSDFGMGYGLPAVGDEIALNINIEAIKQK